MVHVVSEVISLEIVSAIPEEIVGEGTQVEREIGIPGGTTNTNIRILTDQKRDQKIGKIGTNVLIHTDHTGQTDTVTRTGDINMRTGTRSQRENVLLLQKHQTRAVRHRQGQTAAAHARVQVHQHD